MPDLLDIGAPTDEAATLSDEQLNALLGGADTAALDQAMDRAYGDYLGQWGQALAEHIEAKSASNPKGAGDPIAIDLPDIRQSRDFDCGPVCLFAVARHFGAGPDTEADFIALLGADPQTGTPPEAIVAGAKKLGLTAEAKDGLTVEDLAEAARSGRPVICAVQAAGDGESRGHYVVVLGVDAYSVYVQDPAAGRKRIGRKLWERRWHDTGVDGRSYDHYGIVLGKPSEDTP